MKTINSILPESNQEQVLAMGAMEGARRATGVAPMGSGHNAFVPSLPDPEVSEKKPRRKFTTNYKLRILAEADTCTQPGQIGALLRREGLYSSSLATWRRQRENGILKAMTPRKRGRKHKLENPLAKQVAQLEKEKRRLQQKLKKAELIIEAQKKMSEILGIAQNLNESDESN